MSELIPLMTVEQFKQIIRAEVAAVLAGSSPPPTDEEKLYTVDETCKLLGNVVRQTLSAWTRDGKIKATKVGKRGVMYSQSEIDKFLKK